MPVLQGFGRGDQRVLVNVAGAAAADRGAAAPARGVRAQRLRRDLRGGRGVLPEAEERLPLSALRRVSASVPIERAEPARALMLELFPQGFEEVEHADGAGAGRVHRRRGRGAALGGVRRGARRRRAGRLGGALARLSPAGACRADSGSGRRGRRRPTVSRRSWSIPAARSAPAVTRPRASAWSCSTGSSAGACSTSAAARACSRSPPLASALRPCLPSTTTRRRSRPRSGTPPRTGSSSRCGSPTRWSSRSRRGCGGRKHLGGERGAWCIPRLDAAHDRRFRLPRARQARAGRLPPRATRHGGRLGGRPVSARGVESRAVATFSVRFLGCKVSHVDAQEIRERLLADGHSERGRRRRGRGRQHLLRHARGGAQVASRSRAGGPHAPARLRHGLRREPRRRRLRRPA